MTDPTTTPNGAESSDRIVPRQDPAPKTPIVAGGHAMALIPRTFDEVYRMAAMLAQTAMVPKDYQGKPADCAAALLYGLELGLSPVVALQSVAVVNGRPCLWGDALPALVRKHGHRLEERNEGDGESMVAICRLTRSDGEVIERHFSVADAKTARLWGKPGPWQQYPKRMLQMRARGFAVRDGAADILRGLAVVEEMADIREPRDVTPRQSRGATAPSPPRAPDIRTDIRTGVSRETLAPEGDLPVDPPDILPDTKEAFLEAVEDSMAAVIDLDILNEILLANEDAVNEHRCAREMQELYDYHEARIERG